MAGGLYVRNLLLQRVRRHAGMTALFRAVDPDANRERWTSRDSLEDAGSPPVQAALPRVLTGSPGLAAPKPIAPARSSLPAGRNMTASSSAPQVFHSPTPRPGPSPASPEAPAAKTDEEATWRRLETIFRKHAQQAAPQPEQPAPDPHIADTNPPDPAVAAEDAAGAAEAETPVFPLSGALAHPLAARVQRAVELNPAPPQEAAAPSRIAGVASQAQEQDQPPAAGAGQPPADLVESLPSQPPESTLPQSTQSPTQPLAAPLPGLEPVEQAPAASAPLPPLENRSEAAGPLAEPRPLTEARPPISETPTVSEGTEAPAPLQPVPLQAAWPVQRKLAEAAPDPERAIADEPDLGQAGPQIHPLPQQGPAVPAEDPVPPRPVPLRRAMDTPVEIVLPRGPRPAPPGPMQTVQRKVDGGQAPKEPAPPLLPGELSPEAAPPASIQTSLAARPPAAQPAAASRLIPTQAGPLPADLWDLLGEKPPEPEQPSVEPAAGEKSDQPAPLQSNAASQASAVNQASTSAVRLPVSPGPALIQRKLEDVPPPPETVNPAAESTAQKPAEKAAAPKIDVDDLARQVYSELKRRLAVEMERLRRD
jgi:hypothetical protein